MLARFILAIGMLGAIGPVHTWAAGQTSSTFRVAADVFTSANPGLALGSAQFQSSLSVGQFSIAGRQTNASFNIPEGYQATIIDGFDSDYDGISDNDDTDSDNDGIADASDARPYDTDNDTVNNLSDSDDDGEGLSDSDEWAAGTSWTDTDTDDDTYNDYIEYVIAQTDPVDADSYLQCIQIERSSTNTVITWDSAFGVTYYVQRIDQLTNSSGWSDVAGPVIATDSVASVTDANVATQYSYRVRIPY